jgi:tRNA(fMet)-specific endonuclease VapC
MSVLEGKNGEVATTIITVYELLKGAYSSSKPKENLTKVQNVISNLQVLNLSFQACEEASKIYQDFRQAGRLIGEFDVLIAAIARTYDETIMTRDGHYSFIRGIKVTEW